MSEPETLDIIEEMRRFAKRHWMHDEGQNMRMFADRLEASYKRELGNAQKMREALEAVRDAHFVREENGEECEGFYAEADDGTGRPLTCVVEDALDAPAATTAKYKQ